MESLISTLRNHLARLTSELSDHQRLLGELRTLRDSDARALAEKSKDIDTLRHEVERLAGEVEVLRGVIEEGLRERRHAREASMHQAQAEPSAYEHTDEEVATSDEEDAVPDRSMHPAQTLEESDFTESEDEDDESTASAPAGRHSPVRTAAQPASAADRSMALRTDYATVGSSVQVDDLSTKPFVDMEELDRISTDLQDRRSERSASMVQRSQSLSLTDSRGFSRSMARSASPAASMRSSVSSGSRRSSPVGGEDEPAAAPTRETEVSRTNVRQRSPSPVQQEQPAPRPSGPTPAHATRPQVRTKQPEPSSSGQRQEPAAAETPFPQIRGERLERLFFSAPEHNAQTCTVCHRRLQRQGSKGSVNDQRPFWSVGPGTGVAHEYHADDDEGFVEGSDDDVRPGPAYAREGDHDTGKGKERATDRLPPQTVLSRVIRELEDDFTHFKGYVSYLACTATLVSSANDL